DFSDFSINFNPRFMLETLQKVTSEQIKISFEGPLKPFKITPPDDLAEKSSQEDSKGEKQKHHFIHVIVPVRSM
ncbi:MAG: hypothetical protein FWD35_03000, partial [Oscillospiraceae bacterium]|nr:hypothetical protein [Oscillospiraceae bacterium]